MGRRVLFITHDGSRTGAPILLLTLLRWIRAYSDIDMSVLSVGGGPLLSQFARLAPTRTLPPHAFKPLDAHSLIGRRIDRVAQRERRRALGDPDLVYANSIMSAAGVWAIGGDAPMIAHIHEMDPFLSNPQLQPHVETMCTTAASVIAPSAAVRDSLTLRHGVTPDRVRLINGFIDMATHRRQPRNPQLRRALGIADDAFVVGMCGTLDHNKGPDLFLQVAQQVDRAHPGRPFVFLWVGGYEGSEEQRDFHHDIERLRLGGVMRHVVHQPDPRPYLGLFDVMFLSSRSDSFPLACLETAALSEAPLVCFEGGGGACELVAAAGGWSEPYLDTARVTARVLELMHCEEERNVVGRGAAQVVRARYDVSVLGPRVLSLIEAS